MLCRSRSGAAATAASGEGDGVRPRTAPTMTMARARAATRPTVHVVRRMRDITILHSGSSGAPPVVQGFDGAPEACGNGLGVLADQVVRCLVLAPPEHEPGEQACGGDE